MTHKLVDALVGGLIQCQLTTRQMVVLLVVMALTLGGVVVYEIQTSNFQLQKYATATMVLKDLDILASSDNVGIASSADAIVKRISEILAETHADPSLSQSQHRIALALTLGLPWVVFSVAGIVEALRREPDWHYGFFGCLFLAVVLGSVGYMIPTDIHWFYRYLVVPVVVIAALLGLFYVAGEDDEDAET